MHKTVHVFDIDTTIADNSHRAVLLNKSCVVCLASKGGEYHSECHVCKRVTRTHISKENKDKFFLPNNVYQDVPVMRAQLYMNKLKSAGVDIHYITGRQEVLREVTDAWLVTHFGKTDESRLHMRSKEVVNLLASDYKEVEFLKLKNLEKYNDKTLFYFYEDDPFCLNMYSKYGIAVKCPEAWDVLVPDLFKGEEVSFHI